jgi:hypothetical protein
MGRCKLDGGGGVCVGWGLPVLIASTEAPASSSSVTFSMVPLVVSQCPAKENKRSCRRGKKAPQVKLTVKAARKGTGSSDQSTKKTS